MPGLGVLLAVALLGSTVLAALGTGALLAALNVAYRDFRYVIPFMMQMWMFATPTIYMDIEASDSARFQALLALNPMAGLVASFRAAALEQPIPWSQFAISTACVGVIFLVGCLYFRKVEDNFADII